MRPFVLLLVILFASLVDAASIIRNDIPDDDQPILTHRVADTENNIPTSEPLDADLPMETESNDCLIVVIFLIWFVVIFNWAFEHFFLPNYFGNNREVNSHTRGKMIVSPNSAVMV